MIDKEKALAKLAELYGNKQYEEIAETTQNELVQEVLKQYALFYPGEEVSVYVVKRILKFYFTALSDCLSRDEVVRVPKFGTFKLKRKKRAHSKVEQVYVDFSPLLHLTHKVRMHQNTLTDFEIRSLIASKKRAAELWNNRFISKLEQNKFSNLDHRNLYYYGNSHIETISNLEKLQQQLNEQNLENTTSEIDAN